VRLNHGPRPRRRRGLVGRLGHDLAHRGMRRRPRPRRHARAGGRRRGPERPRPRRAQRLQRQAGGLSQESTDPSGRRRRTRSGRQGAVLAAAPVTRPLAQSKRQSRGRHPARCGPRQRSSRLGEAPQFLAPGNECVKDDEQRPRLTAPFLGAVGPPSSGVGETCFARTTGISTSSGSISHRAASASSSMAWRVVAPSAAAMCSRSARCACVLGQRKELRGAPKGGLRRSSYRAC
jgi:hypothetical protein